MSSCARCRKRCREYARQRRQGERHTTRKRAVAAKEVPRTEEATCAQCGTTFPRERVGNRHPVQFCGEGCRRERARRKNRDYQRRLRAEGRVPRNGPQGAHAREERRRSSRDGLWSRYLATPIGSREADELLTALGRLERLSDL